MFIKGLSDVFISIGQPETIIANEQVLGIHLKPQGSFHKGSWSKGMIYFFGHIPHITTDPPKIPSLDFHD